MSATEPTLKQIQETYGQLATGKELFYDWQGLNVWLFKVINSLHGPYYDEFIRIVTRLGEHELFIPYVGLLFIYMLFATLWKKFARRVGVKQHLIMWFGVFAVLGCSALANKVIISSAKEYFEYPRPYVALATSEVTVLEPIEREKNYHSFPSGHVAFITMLIMALWPVLSDTMRKFGLFFIALMAWTRVAAGMHFPADALGAFLISMLVVVGIRMFLYWLFRKILRINCG